MTTDHTIHCREAFEKWATTQHLVMFRHPNNDDRYDWTLTQSSWDAWQSAWNARPQECGEATVRECDNCGRTDGCSCLAVGIGTGSHACPTCKQPLQVAAVEQPEPTVRNFRSVGDGEAWRWRDDVRPALPWRTTTDADVIAQLRSKGGYEIEPLTVMDEAARACLAFLQVVRAMGADSGVHFSIHTTEIDRAVPGMIGLLRAGYFQDDPESLNSDVWQLAAGEDSEARERFSRASHAYEEVHAVLNGIFESPCISSFDGARSTQRGEVQS